MGSRSSSDVRKRIAERRRNRERLITDGKRKEIPNWPEIEEEKEWGSEHVLVYEEGMNQHTKPPLINKEWILFF